MSLIIVHMRQFESGLANEDLLWVVHEGLTISLDGLSLFDMHCIHASFCQYSKIWLQAICNWTMLTKIIVEELRCILKLLKIPQGDQYVPIAQNGWSTFYITCVGSSFRFKEGCFFSALCLQISEKGTSLLWNGPDVLGKVQELRRNSRFYILFSERNDRLDELLTAGLSCDYWKHLFWKIFFQTSMGKFSTTQEKLLSLKVLLK